LEGCTASRTTPTTPGTLVWPTGAGRVELIDCKIRSREVEMDKIVESVLFERCDLPRGASGGAGVLNVRFIDCDIYGFVQGAAPLVDHGRVPLL
jgi:hypothetical protein